MSTEQPALHIDRFRAGHRLRPHRHATPYVALVLEGDYLEVSLDGKYACQRGCLVIHPSFHQHANEFGADPCTVLNLPVPNMDADLSGYRIVRPADPEAFIELAHKDAQAAGRAAVEELTLAAPISPPDWLAHFVSLVLDDMPVGLAARVCGVTVEHAGRMAARWFGVPPCHLRREGRMRRAVAALQEGASPAEAAAAAGFADQPHLTRVLKSATGLTPGRMRKL